jgi:hypothetical protein
MAFGLESSRHFASAVALEKQSFLDLADGTRSVPATS